LRTQPVCRGEIHGVISVAHVESGSVRLHISNSLRNQEIWICVAVSVRICGEIIGE